MNDLTPGYSYTVDECYKECFNYNYFAIQDNNWCVCDNNYDDSIQYGEYDNCNNGIGGPMANAIYQNLACM